LGRRRRRSLQPAPTDQTTGDEGCAKIGAVLLLCGTLDNYCQIGPPQQQLSDGREVWCDMATSNKNQVH